MEVRINGRAVTGKALVNKPASFTFADRGHFGMFAGELQNITRLERSLSRDDAEGLRAPEK